MGSTTKTLTVPALPNPPPLPCWQACGGVSSGGGLRLDESFSLLMRTVFTFFHHSVQIPVDLLALFFLAEKKNPTQVCCLSPPSASGTYY